MVIYYDDSTVDFISGVFWLFVFFVAPLFVSFHLCRNRNRNPIKGLFVTFYGLGRSPRAMASPEDSRSAP